MPSDSIHVRVSGRLQDHLHQQIGDQGLYENASEYVRALIRRDLEGKADAWSWLKDHLEDGLRAEESAFTTVTAADVIGRNRSK